MSIIYVQPRIFSQHHFNFQNFNMKIYQLSLEINKELYKNSFDMFEDLLKNNNFNVNYVGKNWKTGTSRS